VISFNDISKQYGKQVLFVDASFQLNPGDKVGWSARMAPARPRCFDDRRRGIAGLW
jgi:ABC-type phosphonate transport system ATPase subunit